MSLLILTTGIDNQPLTQAFREADPRLDIQIGPDAKNLESVRFALVWKQPPGSLANLRNLEIVFSLGAGVDHLLKDPHFPDLPVVRFVDPDLTQRMVEYVVLHVLAHHRYLRNYNTFQDNLEWKELPQPVASEVNVG
ncbi:MAG: glyoxylate/hydroxypyruvate reductase A, partial [Methyloligellaceae bacterium]